MKCPKCGFTSFDYLESCRKCGNDLVAFKAKHGLRSLLFPGLGRAAEPTAAMPEEAATAEEALLTEAGDATDFGFGFMDEETPAVASTAEAPAAAEDEIFLTDGAPLGEPEGIAPPEDFDLEGESTDLFDLDADAGELPPLDDPGAFDFDAGDGADELFGEDTELPSWDDLDEENPTAKKPAGQEEPPDPFEKRESAVAGRAPEYINGHQHGDEPTATAAPIAPEPAPEIGPQPIVDATPGIRSETGMTSLQPPPAATLEPADSEPPDLEPADLEPEPDLVDPAPTAGAEDDRVSAPLVGRLGALLADLLLLGAVLAGFLLLGQRLLEPGYSGLLPDPALILRLSTPYFLLFFLGCFCYFTLFHLLLGQTPGKMLFGLGVESLDGSSLSPAQAILRSAGGLAALCLGGLGYASVLFDVEGRGWNDRLAGTRVVSWPSRPVDAAEGMDEPED